MDRYNALHIRQSPNMRQAIADTIKNDTAPLRVLGWSSLHRNLQGRRSHQRRLGRRRCRAYPDAHG